MKWKSHKTGKCPGIAEITLIKFRVNYGGGSGAGCFEVKVWAETAKFTDVIVTRLRKCSDLIREGKVFVENRTNCCCLRYTACCIIYIFGHSVRLSH